MRGAKSVVLMGAAAMGLAGCAGSSGTSSANDSAQVTAATAAADQACASDAIAQAVSAAIAPEEELVRLDSFDCSGDFSYAFVTTNSAGGDPDTQIGVTVVLKLDGAGWVVQDRDAVCGTAEIADGPAPYPSDAAVPEPIWQNACQTN